MQRRLVGFLEGYADHKMGHYSDGASGKLRMSCRLGKHYSTYGAMIVDLVKGGIQLISH
jgi:hypothetical protein